MAKNTKKLIALIIVVMTFISIMPMAMAATEVAAPAQAKLNASGVNFRAGASVETAKLGVFRRNTKVTVFGLESGFFKIEYNGTQGYVAQRFLTFTVNGKSVKGTSVNIVASAPSGGTNAPAGSAGGFTGTFTDVFSSQPSGNTGTTTPETGGSGGFGSGFGGTPSGDTTDPGSSGGSSSGGFSSMFNDPFSGGTSGGGTSGSGSFGSGSFGGTANTATLANLYGSAWTLDKIINSRTSSTIANLITTNYNKNSDVIGHISIANTNISYPILFKKSTGVYDKSWYYSTRDITKRTSYAGWYPSYSSITPNIVVWGHNMRPSKAGFHAFHHLYASAIGLSNCKYSGCKTSVTKYNGWNNSSYSRTFDITLFGHNRWEVWAMYETLANEPKSTQVYNFSPNITDGWIGYQLDRSNKVGAKFPGVSVSSRDQILTIIGCGTNYDSSTAQSRLYIFLKAVD